MRKSVALPIIAYGLFAGALVVVPVIYVSWNAARERSNDELRRLAGRLDVIGLCLSEDGESLVGIGEKGLIAIWNVQSGRLRKHYCASKNTIHAFTVLDGGDSLATGDFDGLVSITSLKTGEKTAQIQFEENSVVQGIVYDPTNDLMFVSDLNNELRICKLSEGAKSNRRSGIQARYLSYSKKHALLLAWSSWGELRGARIAGRELVEEFRVDMPAVSQMQMNGDSDFLGVCTRDGSVFVFDIQTKKKLFQHQTHKAPALCVQMAGTDLVFSGGYSRAAIWNWTKNTQTARIVRTDEKVTAGCFSKDNTTLFVATPGFHISEHDQKGESIRTLSLDR